MTQWRTSPIFSKICPQRPQQPGPITWKEGANSNKRAAYTGLSAPSKARKLCSERRALKVHNSPGIMHYLQPKCDSISSEYDTAQATASTALEPLDDGDDSAPNEPLFTPEKLEAAIETLKAITKVRITSEKDKNISLYNYQRYTCILKYFQFKLQGNVDSDAVFCQNLAKDILGRKSLKYYSAQIRKWAAAFLTEGELPPVRTGKHSKVKSLLDEEDIREQCLQYLRGDPKRNPKRLAKHLNKVILPKLQRSSPSQTSDQSDDQSNDESITVSETTARTWMASLGFRYKKDSKGIYMDGHERPDVRRYRKKYLKKMLMYRKRMVHYSGETMEIENGPFCTKGKRMVLVTHDESTFYANEDTGFSLYGRTMPSELKKCASTLAESNPSYVPRILAPRK
ncbi:uncharacterized protein BJ171DRAFT_92100 [Polychytrium aggregatum]|uniref:uncharacterized protein n=1 Tax=Polychytrium aggregatum TaxID=110093 RepID=UPI0022FEBCA6|nr:uncharacterized protein BJ171DRAFT_92100 [Polychytrium aggregatum]KAI9204940.1 hypothetical protein BJ171DRAFT_92100 [Polychytrium aggregatum]